jgi:hypothetical protein
MATTKRVGTRKFGWCLDGLHHKCIERTGSGYTCGCECHEEAS